ncbi:21341_t:CDS:2 [Cetraspora pellucida]|uniref:21341_t:CDS:1 n=1 Tax=Cetraspora pellucida TaxID=1433469 RepID=A0A9N8ZWR3_9GLOM|nr:21341_t:CDS:2 [Cetraspora pellucida]
MDAEARRKHCGLLMFDAPTVSARSQTSRSNDIIINNMSTRGVDSSALNNNLSYESSRNASSMINDFDIFQDCTSDFSTTTRALAAGAAAGDDFIHHGSGDLLNGDESVQRNVDKRRQQRKQTSPRDSTDNRNYSVSTGTTGPHRRKSTRSGNKSPAKSDFTEGLQQSPINMSPQDTNMTPRNEPTNSSYTVLPSLPSPEIPTLVDPPVEYGSQQQINPVTSHLPLTPISPPQMQCEQEFKVRQQQYDPNLLRYVPGGIQVYHNQGNAPQLPFTSMDGFIPSYNPLEYYITSDVPDVAQQQQQMNAETMLHYEQHQITHTPTVSSSNNPSPNERTSLYPQQPAQYYHNGTNTAGNVNSNPTYLNFLAGYECQNFLGGSVNHHIQ